MRLQRPRRPSGTRTLDLEEQADLLPFLGYPPRLLFVPNDGVLGNYSCPSPARGREPHLWTACHFSVYAARKDQEQLQRASRRGIHDYLRSLRRSERLSSEGNCRQGIRYLPRMLEPTRTKAARERQSEKSRNCLPTSAKNKQRTGR